MSRPLKICSLAILILSCAAWSHCGCDPYYPEYSESTGELLVRSYVPRDVSPSFLPLVQATFNHSIIASSVGPDTLRLLDAGEDVGGPAQAVYHADGSCIGVSCTPVRDLEVGVEYTAVVAAGVRSTRGPDALAEAFRWTFHVDPGSAHTWQEPVVLDDDVHPGAALLPVVATQYDPDNATAVWVERAVQEDFSYRDVLRSRTYYSYRTADPDHAGRWGSLRTHVDGSTAEGTPDADGNARGDGSVAFPVRFPGSDAYSLWLGRYEYQVDPGGGQFVEWLLSVERGSSILTIEDPQVGVDPMTHSLVVFVMQAEEDEAPCLYSVDTHLDHGGWGEPARVEAVEGGAIRRPRLAMNEEGRAFAVWEVEDHPSPYHLRGGRYDKLVGGSGWTWVGSLDDTDFEGRARSPSVGLDRGDDAVVVWAREAPGTSSVWGLRFPSSAASPPGPVELSAGLVGRATAPHVAVHPDGRATAVWVQTEGVLETSLVAMRYLPGEGWRDRTVVWRGTRCEEPYVAMGAGGDAIVIWHYGGEALVSHHLRSTEWTEATVVSRPLGTSDLVARPRLVIDDAGRATAIWQQMDYRWRVCAARYETPP